MVPLDTNIIIIILLQQPDRLPEETSNFLSTTQSRFVSVVTLWEMAIKWRLGKLEFGMSIDELLPVLQQAGIKILPMNEHHAIYNVEPDPPTRDPFDRLLLAQCAVEGMRLLTIDRALAGHPLSATADISY